MSTSVQGGDYKAVRSMFPSAIAEAEALGYRRAVDIVASALTAAKAEPRLAGPTERAGRITALGQLLAVLEACEGDSP